MLSSLKPVCLTSTEKHTTVQSGDIKFGSMQSHWIILLVSLVDLPSLDSQSSLDYWAFRSSHKLQVGQQSASTLTTCSLKTHCWPFSSRKDRFITLSNHRESSLPIKILLAKIKQGVCWSSPDIARNYPYCPKTIHLWSVFGIWKLIKIHMTYHVEYIHIVWRAEIQQYDRKSSHASISSKHLTNIFLEFNADTC